MPPHTTENVAERLACHVPEGQGHQVARAELAASVDVEVRQARAAAEGVLALEVGEGGQDGKVLAPGHLVLVLDDAPSLGRFQDDVLAAGDPARGAGFEEVNLQGARRAGVAQEPEKPPALEKFPGAHGDDVGVQARRGGRCKGAEGDGVGVFAPPLFIVLCGIGAVETDARGKDAAVLQFAGPLRRQALARRPHDEAGAVVEGAADLAQVLPQQRLAPRERHDCGAPVLQLRCELADHLEGEVLPAAARIVAVPAAEAAAVCDGKGDGVEARRVVHQKVIQETLEGAAGIGRKLGVDDTLAPEGDDLFPRQVVLEKGGDAGVQLGQRRAGCYLLEELVSAHRAALGGQVLTYTFL